MIDVMCTCEECDISIVIFMGISPMSVTRIPLNTYSCIACPGCGQSNWVIVVSPNLSTIVTALAEIGDISAKGE